MSESTSRAERRALRKVAGVEVLTVVQDTHQAIRVLQTGLASAQQHHARLERDVWTVNDRVLALTNRDFWSRLRWLLTGR